MALIRFAEGQQRSGSIGATVYSHNRYGPYVRARSVPVNPNTDRQVAVRNAVRSLAIAWDLTLTQAQRNAWEVYAANVSWKGSLGEDVLLTGLNHYVRSNALAIAQGWPRIDDAPTLFDLATAELSLGCTATAATQVATVTFDDTAAWCSEDGALQLLYGGLPQNGGIAFFGGPYRYLAAIQGDSGVPPTSPIQPIWPFVFAEGNRLWLRSRIRRADGRLSEFAQVNFLAAA